MKYITFTLDLEDAEYDEYNCSLSEDYGTVNFPIFDPSDGKHIDFVSAEP